MSASMTILNGLIALLSWQGQANTTYTIQFSGDLRSWSTFPAVFSGNLEEITVSLEMAFNPFFTRFRTSTNGDTNGNGLPDQWELARFGVLDVDPLADPDGDGVGNYTEWLTGTDPLDYYNGARPRIHLSCGRDWILPTGGVSAQGLSLLLTDSNDEPWPNAPVSLKLRSAAAGILQPGEDPRSAVHEVIAYTDGQGRITPFHHAIHILGGSHAGHRDQLCISAGLADTEINIRTIDSTVGQPPRELRYELLANGTLEISWSGEPGEAEAFLVETLSSEGDWIPLEELTASALPAPDPESHRFHLDIGIQ